MKKNLIKMIADEANRIKELNHIIPQYQKSLELHKNHPKYSHLKNKLDELLLEYKERTGEDYTEYRGHLGGAD